MNILLLNYRLGIPGAYGGIESHSKILAPCLAEKAHKIIVGCCIDGYLTTADPGLPVPAKKIRIRNSGDLSGILKMIKVIKKECVDVIIANHGREYWPAALAAKIAGVKVVFVRHQMDRLKKTTCRLINGHVHKVIAVSGAVKKALIESGVYEEKIDIIYNPVDLKRFSSLKIDRDAARRELGINTGDIVVGAVTKLYSGKGVFELLRAVAGLTKRHPSIRLIFAGDGDDRPMLEQEAQRLSVRDRVIFVGVRKDPERIYAALDIFAHTPVYGEAFGMVILEAMAMCKPVVATMDGGIPEIVQNSVNGLLVPARDPDAIAEAVSRYICDPSFSEKIAVEGRRTAEQKFSIKAMCDNFEMVLEQVIRPKSFSA